MTYKKALPVFIGASFLSCSSLLIAQDKMPIFSKNREVMELVEADRGAVLDIGGGMVLVIPVGIDVSGVFTFKKTTDRPSSSQIDRDFTRHGPTTIFDAAVVAKDEPIRVGLGTKRPARRKGQRFVLAAEYSGECDAKHARYKLEDGTCSHWLIVETEYEEDNKRMVGKLERTYGFRFQFGWMPK